MSACPPKSIFRSIVPHVTSVSECWVTGSVSTEDLKGGSSQGELHMSRRAFLPQRREKRLVNELGF